MHKIRVFAAAALSALLLAGCSTMASPVAKPSPAYVPLTNVSFHTTAAAAVAAKKSAHMTISLGSMGSGEGDVSSSPLEMSMTMHLTAQGKSTALSMEFVDSAFYMQIPGLTPAGKWVKVDASTPGFGPVISALENMSPQKALEMQQQSMVSLKYVGPDTIDGQAVRHYTVIGDPVKAVEAMGVPLTPAVKAKLPAELTVEMYLNADNTPHRVVSEVPTLPGGAVTVDFTNWGESVSVQAPPASSLIALP